MNRLTISLGSVERVRRDEERAAAIEAGDKARIAQADSEARLALLRKKAKNGKRKEEVEAEKVLDRQLGGRGKGKDTEDSLGKRTQGDESEQNHEKIMMNGHCKLTHAMGRARGSKLIQQRVVNFWADLERGQATASTSSSAPRQPRGGNPEIEAEKKTAEQKLEEQLTMYIRSPAPTWYSSSDRLSAAERSRSADQKLEYAYKDNVRKSASDPMNLMQEYLKRRSEVKNAAERAEKNPWMDTPRTLKGDKTPVQPKGLLIKRGKDRQREEAAAGVTLPPEGPARPPNPETASSEDVLRQAAQNRELSEKDRAKALRAAARSKNSSVASDTPRSDFGYQTGMYNRRETREAKGYAEVRWDEGRRRSESSGRRW